MTHAPLLILSCSATKRRRPAPAINLYDGPAYRTTRKAGTLVQRPRTAILSAEHGLICQYTIVEPYNRKMDDDRVEELQEGGFRQAWTVLYRPLTAITSGALGPFTDVFFMGGKNYRRVIRYWENKGLFRGTDVEYSSGGIGTQLHQLKAWLREHTVKEEMSRNSA